MKFMIPSPKPHFFKPLLAGFRNGIRIPTSFSEYVIGPGESYPEKAVLKKDGKVWRADVVNGHFTGEGWRRFAEENGLKEYDFVVFEHLGNMVFNAMIFDAITDCGKDEALCTKTEFQVKKEVLSDSDKEEAVPDLSILNMPNYFISRIKPYNYHFRWSYLRIPAAFARSFGLADGSCEITVKDGRGRSWFMDLKINHLEVRMRRGSRLHEFFTANGFKEGDSYKFEVVSTGNGAQSPVVRITPHVLTTEAANRGLKHQRISEVNVSGSESKKGSYYPVVRFTTPDHVETKEAANGDSKRKRRRTEVNISESENGGYPCFTSKIRNYSAMHQCLCIPLEFARANGLIGKEEMILMNEGRSSWRVNLRSTTSHFRIAVGWKDFRDDNGIKEGDAFRFEIVENEEVPVVRFTVMAPAGSVGSG